jgi:DNA-binding response OmpR family regulator
MSDMQTARTPIVYFIDDSATMREVIKIAFRKENIQVITCPDAASALEQFLENAPDAVITDVIMPDKDGYEVCEFIKRREEFAKTPVILMSGVVNKTVAEKAMAVKADELIRKPFQPQDLIARVKKLLNPNAPAITRTDDSDSAPASSNAGSHVLSGLFAPAHAQPAPSTARQFARAEAPVAVAPPPAPAAWTPAPAPTPRVAVAPSAELQKLRNEVRRLELLVKKLQAELAAKHQYSEALEAHIRTLQESE